MAIAGRFIGLWTGPRSALSRGHAAAGSFGWRTSTGAILGSMKLYFAAPLFSGAERTWNAEVAQGLRDGGHEVFLPQDQEPGKDAPDIFTTDLRGIDRADALVAIVDGPDPDSGTAWECGYAYGKKPIVLVRTDFRTHTGSDAPYNAMLTGAATTRLDLPFAPTSRVVAEVLDALRRLIF